ncbi:hypothetical protein [Roseimaritima ulvae]|nr:hypothetical protein [Roseimaritima ulvae]
MVAGSTPFRQALSLSRWQMFFAVVCFVVFGLVALYLLMMLIVVGGMNGGGMMLGRMSFATCLTGLFTLIYVVVGMLFVRSSMNARKFSQAPQATTLVAMLESQLWLWRIIAGLSFLALGMWLVGMSLAMFVG